MALDIFGVPDFFRLFAPMPHGRMVPTIRQFSVRLTCLAAASTDMWCWQGGFQHCLTCLCAHMCLMRILQVPYRACAGAIFAWRDRECHARVEAKNQGRKPCRYGEMMFTRRCLFVLDCAVRCGSLNFCLLFLRPLCFFVSFFYFPRDRLLCSDSFSWLVTSSRV